MKKATLILFLLIGLTAIKAQKIHFVSALGADSTIYSNIELNTIFPVNHVEWLIPLKKESIESYCQRLIAENNISSNDILIGTSFGGIVAVEIGKIIQPKKIILISSISNQNEKPAKFKFLKLFRFNKLIPKSWLNNPDLIIRSCFGDVTTVEREFLSAMIIHYNVELVYWSLNQIMKFDNKVIHENVVKINGSRDKTFPIKNIRTDYLIDGTHLMVYSNAKEISKVLNNELATVNLEIKLLAGNEEKGLIKQGE
jgi:hypothetical protein